MFGLFSKIQSEITTRYELLETALNKLNSIPLQALSKNPQHLAATDVFIEKAQRRLTIRAYSFFVAGWILLILAFYFLVMGFKRIYSHDLVGDIMRIRTNEGQLDGPTVTLFALKATGLIALILGAVYAAFSFAKAFFHEGTNLFNKRHALRFGRLYVYLYSENIVFSELERAFNWNIENSTAFKDIKIETIASTIPGKLAEQPAKIAQAFGSRGKIPKDD
jgi:uncharacterized membrane protein